MHLVFHLYPVFKLKENHLIYQATNKYFLTEGPWGPLSPGNPRIPIGPWSKNVLILML